MADNHPDDRYFYEITVETGPKDSHATTANIYFILAGSDEESGARLDSIVYSKFNSLEIKSHSRMPCYSSVLGWLIQILCQVH